MIGNIIGVNKNQRNSIQTPKKIKKKWRGETNYNWSWPGMKLSRFLICMNLQLLKAEMRLRENINRSISVTK